MDSNLECSDKCFWAESMRGRVTGREMMGVQVKVDNTCSPVEELSVTMEMFCSSHSHMWLLVLLKCAWCGRGTVILIGLNFNGFRCPWPCVAGQDVKHTSFGARPSGFTGWLTH